MTYAPVAVFAYNRVDKLKMCLEALERNPLVDKTDLFLFAGGAGQAFCVPISKFNNVKIIGYLQNLGLANSIIGGVTKVINKHKK